MSAVEFSGNLQIEPESAGFRTPTCTSGYPRMPAKEALQVKYRALGNTGMMVSEVGLGCGQCVTRCPFGIDAQGNMREAASLSMMTRAD